MAVRSLFFAFGSKGGFGGVPPAGVLSTSHTKLHILMGLGADPHTSRLNEAKLSQHGSKREAK